MNMLKMIQQCRNILQTELSYNTLYYLMFPLKSFCDGRKNVDILYNFAVIK